MDATPPGAAEPSALITTVTETYERISMHGVRRELLARQADAAGIALARSASRRPAQTILRGGDGRGVRIGAAGRHVDAVAFGDLFLEDVRAYREQRLAANARRGLFPLWGRDTGVLAREFIAAGFEADIVCLDPRALDPSFAGRPYDERLLARSARERRSLR